MSLSTMLIIVISLILVSAIFSSSETAMMALNRYKLKHLAKKNHPSAKRSLRLLERPDRLLGMILVGNTFANIIASAVLTSYAETHLGHFGIIIATISLTMAILIFGEVIPKTFAAIFPQRIAFPLSRLLSLLLKLFYPLVWLLNLIANSLLRLLGINVNNGTQGESLSKEEIHTVVHDSKSKLGHRNKNMLIGVLELENITVKDVMIPHHKISYIDLNDNIDNIYKHITTSRHSILMVCEGNINNVIGTLKTKRILSYLPSVEYPSIEQLRTLIQPAYFIPESVSLQKQLINFQRNGSRFAVTVDEYGDVQGIVTVEDIIEEIVGEFADTMNIEQVIQRVTPHQFKIKGEATLREMNRHLGTHLPTSGAKTLSGFLLEQIETLPNGAFCMKIEDYVFEVIQVENNKIGLVNLTITPQSE